MYWVHVPESLMEMFEEELYSAGIDFTMDSKEPCAYQILDDSKVSDVNAILTKFKTGLH